MDRGRIAEGVLSLAMEPGRAASVSGDLLETGAARGPVWYWSNLARTVAGTVGRDLGERPLFFAGLAARAALLLCALLLLVGRARGLVFGWVRSVAADSMLAHHPKEWLWPAVRLASLLATFAAGRWSARRSRGRDVAACVAMSIVFPFIYYGASAASAALASGALRHGLHLPSFGRCWYHWRDAAFMAAFVLGVAVARRRPELPGWRRP